MEKEKARKISNPLITYNSLQFEIEKVMKTATKLLIITLTTIAIGCSDTPSNIKWPEVTQESKAWTRWWWMGNAVDKESITWQLESFAQAGLGGVEITPIYGVKGYENKFLDFLSPEWLDMLDHTLAEADRLGLGVDMTMGTGWPYGGPQVEPEYAATKLLIQKYPVKLGETFKQEISINDPKQKPLATLADIVCITNNGDRKDISTYVDGNNVNYTADEPATLYALFCSKTRQRVKRSAPGGAGYTLDHFSQEAFDDYVLPYNKALAPFKNRLNTIFNDSYEVYHADFSPHFLQEFEQRRGYQLQDYITLLDRKPDTEEYKRLVCDYRQTMGEMLHDNFAEHWHQWANNNTFRTRYQAHGSPGNIIDLYATADIPECEVFGSPHYAIPGYRRDTNNVRKGDSNKMMLKFCSSAAHLQGHEIVSSESFTWLREHFKTALSQCKPVADDLFLSGINHIFLHGSTYTPKEEKWPGWKFYASVNFNETNTIWNNASIMFDYIARCQAILQKAETDHDVLLYWPIHDAYTTTKPKRLLHQFGIHSIHDWLEQTSFYQTALELDKSGIGFDYVSDQFLQQCKYKKGDITLPGKVHYKTIVVPRMTYIPLDTFKKLLALKKAGANILFLGAPVHTPGLYKHQEQEAQLKQLISENQSLFENKRDIIKHLSEIEINGEKASKSGLKLLRKRLDGDVIYFIANHSPKTINDYIPFNVKTNAMMIMNPMTQKSGLAKIKKGKNNTFVKLYIEPGESLFLRACNAPNGASAWSYLAQEDTLLTLNKNWEIKFLRGGPKLPQANTLKHLTSWTTLGKDEENFSGTAVYSTNFSIQKETGQIYKIHLGDVRESARIILNGKEVCTLIAQPFSADITPYLIAGKNQIKIEVTNLAANRLKALESQGEYKWKKFYEINIVNIHYQKFDAASWQLQPSGLLGPISITSVTVEG